MRRTIAKNLTLVAAILVGVHGINGFAELAAGQLLSGLVTLLVTGVLVTFLARRYKSFRKYQNETYEWYMKQQLMHSGKRPVCVKCGGTFLQTRRLMRYTYTREHFCGTCATPLYYSDES